MASLAPGMMLAAAPMMLDPNFRRAVVLLCEHTDEGSFGLIVNRPLAIRSEELDEMLHGHATALSFGGPVQPTSLHYLHDLAALIPGSEMIHDGVHWGGDFDTVRSMAETSELGALDIRFFLGYAGWGPGQLESEVENHDWIPSPGRRDLIFDADSDESWSTLLAGLGGHYKLLANFPPDPRMN